MLPGSAPPDVLIQKQQPHRGRSRLTQWANHSMLIPTADKVSWLGCFPSKHWLFVFLHGEPANQPMPGFLPHATQITWIHLLPTWTLGPRWSRNLSPCTGWFRPCSVVFHRSCCKQRCHSCHKVLPPEKHVHRDRTVILLDHVEFAQCSSFRPLVVALACPKHVPPKRSVPAWI